MKIVNDTPGEMFWRTAPIVEDRATHQRFGSWNFTTSARNLVALDTESARPRTDIDRVRPFQTAPRFGNVIIEDDSDWGEQDDMANIPRKTVGAKMIASTVSKSEDRGDA